MEKIYNTLRQEFLLKLEGMKKTLVFRNIKFSELRNKIKVAIGIRRSGKTSMMFQKILELQEAGVPLSKIHYINFEDDRLLPLDHIKLSTLLEHFFASQEDDQHHELHIFLDEIQNISEWPMVIRRVYDSKGCHIYLTGSSAKLLSKEISTHLRGRSLSTEVFPFSFSEFLKASNKKNTEHMGVSYFRFALTDYLSNGGFPETINQTAETKQRILDDYMETITFRDLIERHQITNIGIIRDLVKFLLTNISVQLSTVKIHQALSNHSKLMSVEELSEYMSYIEECYLAFSVRNYNDRNDSTVRSTKIFYAIDTGVIQRSILNANKNREALFKNLFFLELKRKSCEIYFYITRSGDKIDFLSRDLVGNVSIHQVVWDTSDQLRMKKAREALKSAEEELGFSGSLITPDSYIEMVCSYSTEEKTKEEEIEYVEPLIINENH